MKIYFMKQKAIDFIKANIDELYINYYKYDKNDWIYDLFDYDPFELFMEIPNFNLSPTTNKAGFMELENCKIIYSNLMNISPSQASDERLWAGMCNSSEFYGYVRERWGYPKMKFKDKKNDASTVLSRFFYKSANRAGMYRNTFSKCWWIGYLTFNTKDNSWFKLDTIGPEDFSSKANEIFYSNTFSANEQILAGICLALNTYRKRGIELQLKKHIRPAMQYLNVLGGAVLLDTYSKDDIANIVTEFIEQIRGDKENKTFSFVDEEEEQDEYLDETVNVDYLEQMEVFEKEIDEFNESVVSLNADEVVYGCQVIVHKMPDDKDAIFIIPFKDQGSIPYITEKMIGMKIGEKIKSGKIEYTIKEILI